MSAAQRAILTRNGDQISLTLSDRHLLPRPPHRQTVFTFPKALQGFFRCHRTLYGEIARQLYAMIALPERSSGERRY